MLEGLGFLINLEKTIIVRSRKLESQGFSTVESSFQESEINQCLLDLVQFSFRMLA